MGDQKEFQQRVQKIGELVERLETIADPAVRSGAKELVQLLMELHGTGLERLLEIVFQAGDAGSRIIDDLGREPLVSSLLILYGLHPDDLPARVERKLQQIRSQLQKMGADVTLISTDQGSIRVRASVTGHTCGSTTRTVQNIVEEALYEAAPDLKSLVIEGLESPAASGFIAMDTLLSTLPQRATPASGTD